MAQDMLTDITLDHLPDLSDASVSFQIPHNASADLLLADHTGGFDLLCNASDDDAGFAPAALRVPRGPPLALGELTPRVQPTSRPPPHSRSSTPAPSVIQPPLTLGHPSPTKPRQTPPSLHRLLQSPFVSEERLDQLRADVATLGQADDEPSHVRTHVMPPAQHGLLECPPPSHPISERSNDAPDGPPPSEDSPPEEKDTHHGTPSADPDAAMPTADNGPAGPTNTAVPSSRPHSNRNPRTTAKPAVAAGGIAKRRPFPTTRVSKKTKDRPSRVQEAHNVLPSAHQLTKPQSVAFDSLQELVPPACMSGNTDFKSDNNQITHPSSGGMADRLVSYSQSLISSIGLYKPWPESSSAQASNDAVKVADARTPAAVLAPSPPPQCMNNTPNAPHEPLRLSEISPHKPPANAPQPNPPAYIPQEGRQHAVSPMRRAKKRVSIDADLRQEYHRRKRGKTNHADTDSERRSSDEAVSQAQPEALVVTHPAIRGSTQHPDSSKSTLPSARTKYRPQFSFSSRCKGPTLDPFPYLSSSRQVQETISKGKGKGDEAQPKAASVRSECLYGRRSASSLLRHDRRARRGPAHARPPSGPTSAGDLPLIEKKQNATLSVAPLTKPVGFTFRVDARLGARKAEERLAASEPGKIHSVPESKARRASHHAPCVFPKAIVPSVPAVPFFFCTEQRAREREKFDAMVKHKEEEMERLKEAQRQREVEEEELAIRELRRRAVPKANEIPEWYADMPKRKGTAV